MQPDQIARSYNALASQWLDPQIDTNGIRQHEHALKLRLDGGLALDVGSGCNGRFIGLLSSRGYVVEGLDISEEMIALAKTRHPNVKYHHVDVCDWTPSKQYDFISAWDSIWHVPLAQSEAVLKKLLGALTPGGVLIWTTAGLDEPAEKTDSSMGQPLYYSVPGIGKTLRAISDSGCSLRHFEFDQWPEKHVWIAAQSIRK